MVNENEKEKFVYAGVAAILVLSVCLVIGILDEYKLLDKILDFLGIS